MIAALAALESKGREQVAQVKADNFIFIDVNVEVNVDGQAGREKDDKAPRKQDAAAQQLMLLQVNQALLRDQQANAAQRELDNVLRVAAMEQREREKSTVIVVVTEIKVKEADLFKQEALVANRGKQVTQTVMGKHYDCSWCTSADWRLVFDPRTLTATEPASAEVTDAGNGTKPAEVVATKTAEAVLYNARPTYTAIIEDPAALMREALEAALDDRRKDENRRNDEEVNIEVSVDVKILIEKDNGRDHDKNDDKDLDDDRERELERQRQQEQEQKDKDQQQAEKDRQEAEKQRAEAEQREQDKKDAEEKQKQEEERAKAEAEKQKQDEEIAKLEAEKKKQEEDKAKAEAEKKLEEAKAKAEVDKKQREENAKAEAEQKAKAKTWQD